jgi:type IV pilus assembly protein PilX
MKRFIKNAACSPSPHGQRGVVLVVALIMLVVMTLLALSAAQVTGLDERMASHSRDRDVAFQAAEAALREGERVLQLAVLPAFDGSAGLYPVAAPGSTPRWKTLDWTVSGISYGGAISGVSAQPRYIVEEIAILPGAGDSLDASEPAGSNTYYRVTARAVGGDGNTIVVLQTTYRRR